MSTNPSDTAGRARDHVEELSAGFQNLLAKVGIQGWRLVSFRIEPLGPGVKVKAAAGCGPDEVYDCRPIDGTVVCGCFPKD